MGAMPPNGAAPTLPARAFSCQGRTVLKTFFTISPRARYASAMFMLAAAAAIAIPSPDAAPAPPVRATVRATASVRILSGTAISWGTASSDVPKIRVTQVRDAAGAVQPIRLIEFE